MCTGSILVGGISNYNPRVRRTIWYLAILALAVAGDPLALELLVRERDAKTLSVAATTPFRTTGVTLAKGQHATIAATGVISYGSDNAACAGSNITPNGCSAEQHLPGAAAAAARSSAASGTARPFIVGKHKTVEGPGALWLGINDQAGAITATTPAPSTSRSPLGPGEEVAKVLKIFSGHLYVRRDGSDRVTALQVGELIYVGDELLTTQDGRVALEFEIGGRVKVGPGATVTVTGERSVDGGKEEDTSLKFVTGSGKPSRVEIQTNGGVIGGIKG